MRLRHWTLLGTAAVFAAGAALASACGQDGTTVSLHAADASIEAAEAATPFDAGGPVITNLAIQPGPNSVLTAIVTFTTDRPALDSARVANVGDGGLSNSFDVPGSTTPTTTHTINVIGMRALSNFDVTVTATDSAWRASSRTVHFKTPALPAFIPPIQVVMNDPSKTSPGYTLFTLWEHTGNPAAANPPDCAILILDQDFQVVWYFTGAPDFPWAAQ
jgi:hypothetical protein